MRLSYTPVTVTSRTGNYALPRLMVFFVRQVADRTAGGDPITQAQLDELKRDQRAWNEWDYLGPTDDECPFEWKPTDWGVLDGRLVAVDYAATCHNGDC